MPSANNENLNTAAFINSLIESLICISIRDAQHGEKKCTQKMFGSLRLVLGLEQWGDQKTNVFQLNRVNAGGLLPKAFDTMQKLEQSDHVCNWLAEALSKETAYKELAVQTEQPRFQKIDGILTPPLSPCERTRQVIRFEALSVPQPQFLNRAPLADRFCYMLTDFASALYCSLAIMCCCTPNMFR